MIGLPELKLAIRHALDSGDTTENALLQQYEAAAVDLIQKMTGRYFGAEDAEAELVAVGDGTSILRLPELASAVTAVTERLYDGDAGTEIEADDSDGFALRLSAGQTMSAKLYRKGGAVWKIGYEYAVTGTIGYAAGQEPAVIRQAVTEIVRYWYDKPSMSGAERTLSSEFEKVISQMIWPWVRIAV